MNIELTYMELLDLRIVLNAEIVNNDKAIERYSQPMYDNSPALKRYHVEKNEKLNLLLIKLETYATIQKNA